MPRRQPDDHYRGQYGRGGSIGLLLVASTDILIEDNVIETGRGGDGGAGGGGGGGPSIGIFEDADSSSTRNGNRVMLGDPGAGGESPAGVDGEDGQRAVYVKLDSAGQVGTLQVQ